MKHVLATGIAVLLGVAASAEPPLHATRPAWQWTDEERLAARFDPTQIKERRERYVADHPQLQGSESRRRTEAGMASSSCGGLRYVIDGRRNPELLMPTELFDGLLTGFTPAENRALKQRALYKDAILKLGYDERDFWSRLESATAAYLPTRFFAGNFAAYEQSVGEHDLKCRQRFTALEAARKEFGRENFDQLLYAVVAPTVQYSEATADPDPTATHLRQERGCQ